MIEHGLDYLSVGQSAEDILRQKCVKSRICDMKRVNVLVVGRGCVK